MNRRYEYVFGICLCFIVSFCFFAEVKAQENVLSQVVNIIQIDDGGFDISNDSHTPSNLGARVVSPTQILLEWNDNTNLEDGYIIERSDEGGSFSRVGEVDENFENYIDNNLDFNVEYTYRVAAIRNGNLSKYSNESSASILVSATAELETEELSTLQEIEGISSVIEVIPFGKEIEDFFRENEAISRIAAIVGAIATAIAVAIATFFPLLSLVPHPFQNNLWSFIIFPFFKRKIKDAWGIVFDAQTKVPISGALVKLINKKGMIVDRVVTDKRGRYGFLISKDDEYKIEVEKGEYSILTGLDKDNLYGSIYGGGFFVTNKDEVIHFNIAVKLENFDWDEFAKKLSRKRESFFYGLKKYLTNIVALVGLICSLGIVYSNPNPLNYAILSLYVVMFITRVTYKIKKPYGYVRNVENKKPLPFSMVSLYDKESNQRDSFAIADVVGRYYMLTRDGEYKLKLSVRKEGGKYFVKEGEEKVRDGILKKDYEL